MTIITVERGDTVSDIALRYNVSINQIINDNGLDQAGTLVPGQSLIILYGLVSESAVELLTDLLQQFNIHLVVQKAVNLQYMTGLNDTVFSDAIL